MQKEYVIRNLKRSIVILITFFLLFYSGESVTKIVPLGNAACTGPGLKTTQDGDTCNDWEGEGVWYVKCEVSNNLCFDVVEDENCDWWLKIYYLTGPYTLSGNTHTYKIFELPDSTWTSVQIVGP